MITPTTQSDFTPRGVEAANAALTKFLRWLKAEDLSMKYVSGMDLTPKRGLIHFNIVYSGSLPKKKRIKDYWHSLTGCHDIKIKEAHSNAGYYLAKRASELPNTKDEGSSDWSVATHGFRRIRRSAGLFAHEPKKNTVEEKNWVARFVGDEYPEEMLSSYSMTADTALPRKAGDIADQSSLTEVVHGHEGEHRE